MEIAVVHNKSVYNNLFYVIHFSPILYNAIPFLSNWKNTKRSQCKETKSSQWKEHIVLGRKI